MLNNTNSHTDILQVLTLCFLILLIPQAGYGHKQKEMSKKEYQLFQYAERADSCASLGDYDKALELINQAYSSVKKPQRYKDGYYSLKIVEGLIYLMTEDPSSYEKTIQVFKEVETKHPLMAPLVYRDLGVAYLSIGDYSSAIHYLELADQDKIEGESVYRILRSKELLASAYIGIGDNDKAAETLISFINEQKGSLSQEEYIQLLVKAYYDIVIDNDGNIVWYDKGALHILQELADDAKNKDTSRYVYFIGQVGQIAQVLGNFSLAYDCALEAINHYTPDCNRPLHFYYSSAALAASRLGRFTEAHDFLDHAVVFLKNEQDSLGAENHDYVAFFEKQLKSQRAILYLDEGINNDIAISLLEELLSDDNLSVDDRAQYLYNLGQAYETVDFFKAEDVYTQALSCYEQTADNHGIFYAKTLNKLGQVALHTGGHDNALKYFELAIDVFRRRSGENNYSYALTLGNAAKCALQLRQYGRAIAWGEESCRLQRGEIGYMYPGVWEMLLTAYQRIGNRDEYERVFQEFETISKIDSESSLLYQLRLIDNQFSRGDVEGAICSFAVLDSLSQLNPSFNDELVYRYKNTLFPENDDLFMYYSQQLARLDTNDYQSKAVFRSLGFDCISENDYASANSFFKLAYVPNSKDNSYLNSSFRAAHYCEDSVFEQTIKEDILSFTNEQFRNVVGLTDTEKENAWMASKDLLNLLFAFRENDASDELLFDILLRTKNIALRSNDAIRDYIASSDNNELYQAAEELKLVKRQIIEGRISLSPETLDSLRLREIKLNRSIANSLKDLSTFDALNGASFKNITKQLGDDEIAIEIVEYPFNNNTLGYGAFVITNQSDKPYFVELCAEQQLAQYAHIEPRKLYNRDLPFSQELYKLIWGPISSFLPNNGQVYVSADGIISTIAFEAIVTPDDEYICDHIKISRLSSTAELCDRKTRKQWEKAVVFGGINYESSIGSTTHDITTYSDYGYIQDRSLGSSIDYLPGTKIEAENVTKHLRRGHFQTDLYLGDNGTEERFKSLSGSEVSIIHIATHGFYQPKDKITRIGYLSEMDSYSPVTPLQRSGLLMAGCAEAWNGRLQFDHEDGVLTASEISALDLSNTNLVVMSACESGLGEITDDGVAGLQRGFKNAGVNSLIMSLWKVDDKATEMLMSNFYSFLSDGSTINDAFRRSREKMRSSRQFSDPYYWAGFIILD